jgi:phosphohistidine phosphatase
MMALPDAPAQVLDARTRRPTGKASPLRLLLWRHAKSSWEDASLEDRERPLSPRGRRAARAMAQQLARDPRNVPTLILCSPARRALETLAPLLPSLSADTRVEVEEALYLAGANHLLERLRNLPDEQPGVLLIGHNPGLQDLALLLARPVRSKAYRQLCEKLPTGALVELELASDSWHPLSRRSARLAAWTLPRELAV